MRALTSLTLAGLLTASMAVPALASSQSGRVNGYAYTWTVTRNETYSMANITCTESPTTVYAYVENTVYNELNEMHGVAKSGETPSSGYSSATAIARNVFEYRGVLLDGPITETRGSLWVGSELVANGAFE